jgi:drug/metabolite transporter (DMT)-like permease
MRGRAQALGTLALIATAALWGSNHVVARAAREAIPLPALVFWRWLPAVSLLTLVALPALKEARPAIRPRLGELVLGGAIGVGLFSFFLIGGAYQSLAIEVGFINATTPVWVLLLGAWMGGGRLSGSVAWGVALAFAGTLLIISKGDLRALTELRFNLGNVWSLLGAMSFAWFSIRVRAWTTVIAPLPLTVVTAWSGVVVVLLPVYVVWLMLGGRWLVYSDADLSFALWATAYIGLAPTMLGNLFYLYGVAALGAARAAAFLYLSPLFSAAFSIIWLGERPAWYHAAGFAAIFAGLALIGRTPQPQSVPVSKPESQPE